MPKSGPYNEKEHHTLAQRDELMFSWEHQYLTRSLERTITLAPLTCCSFHSNIKFLCSRHRVKSSLVIPGTEWEAFK